MSYKASFSFHGGGSFSTQICVIPDRFSLSLPAVAVEPGFPTHNVELTPPLPPKVEMLFQFLREPWQKAAGIVLWLEHGSDPRRTHDPSLVMR